MCIYLHINVHGEESQAEYLLTTCMVIKAWLYIPTT